MVSVCDPFLVMQEFEGRIAGFNTAFSLDRMYE
jgi:hypothetical protein